MLFFPHKYPLGEEGNPIPNKDTKWYCYIMMILNTIGKGPVYRLNFENFYDYIQYLKDAGFKSELLDNFVNIYTNKPNYFPRGLLDNIPANL